MTNVSKKKLNTEQQKELRKQIVSLFAATDKRTAEGLFSELFTETEQIMFFKRLAVVALIEKGFSCYRISKTLKVSETTVQQIFVKYDDGGYEKLCGLLCTPKFNSEKFWKTLETLLQAGMPPMGRGRWKSILN